MVLPQFKGSLDIDCFEEEYDDSHLSRRNWVLVDEVTGIVLHSKLYYTLSGSVLVPPFALKVSPLLEVN